MGLPLALTTAVLWGILPLALMIVLEDMDAYTVTWYRFVMAASVLVVVLGVSEGLPKMSSLRGRTWRLLAMAVAGIAGNYVLFLLGLEFTSPTVTQVIGQLGALFLMGVGVMIFREHLRGLQLWGIVVLLAGLLLFFNRRLPELAQLSGGFGLGVALLVLGAAVWTFYGTAQKFLQPHLGAQHILLLVYTGAAIVILPLASPTEIRSLSSLQLGLLAFCGINTVLAYGAFAESLKHWEMSRVGAVLAVTPLFTLLSVWVASSLAPTLVRPERLNVLSIAGALLVVSGSALCALGGVTRPAVVVEPAAEP